MKNNGDLMEGAIILLKILSLIHKLLIKSMILHLKKKHARNEGVWLIWCPLDIAGLKSQYNHLSRQTFSWLYSHFDRSSKLTGKLYFFTFTLEIAKTVKS